MANADPYVNINLDEVAENNDAARHIVAGFAVAMPVLADTWRYIRRSLEDVPVLISEVVRLSDQLSSSRLDRANLLAAVRATLAAHHDGERDYLSYLHDELTSQGSPTTNSPGRA